MSTGPNWITTSGFLFTATELVSTSTKILASGTNLNYRIITGSLPSGLNFTTTGTIFGIPSAVLDTTNYQFVVRASSSEGISDRSFIISVAGRQAPTWSTSSGFTHLSNYNTSTAYLKLGPRGERFALNKQYVNFKFVASATNAPPNTKIEYYIPENGGTLPPGLRLNLDGTLSGFMDDNLIYDGTENERGGYDEREYDNYSYDFDILDTDSIGVPKIYQFRVSASDGVLATDRYFKILVVSPDIVRSPQRLQMTIEPGLITTNSNYVPPPQFLTTITEILRAENNETIDISAYDGYPEFGKVQYSVLEGTTTFSKLPDFLQIDVEQGKIYGYIPYQPAYEQTYSLTVQATKVYNTNTVTATNTLTIVLKGEVESSIQWITSSSLGTLYTGYPSELSVEAKQVNSEYTIKYSLIKGALPSGLNLDRDGSISGSAVFASTGTYNFTVRAQDVHELSSVDRQFNLKVENYSASTYTKFYVKPFLSLDKRKSFREFISDEFVFPQQSIYRYYDPNFGLQTDIKMVLEFGIQIQNLADYLPAFRENFYRKRFYFGDIKLAVAKNNQGDTIYEVVYVDVIDNMEVTTTNNDRNSVSKTLYTNDNIYYPSSITNMRDQFSKLTLNSNDFISIDEFYLPLFMRTPQEGDYRPPGYIHVIPLCYAKAGEGDKIIKRIKLKNFDFKQFDMDIDRIIVSSSLDNASDKYLLFPRKTITDKLESDSIIYVFDETPLQTDTNDIIKRE